MSALPDDAARHRGDLAPATGGTELRLRSYRSRDRPEVIRLYREGSVADFPDPLDWADDCDNIEDVYLKRPQNHFWVAEVGGRVVASIAVMKDDRQVAHVHRLRVEPTRKMWRGEEIAGVLIAKATCHARRHDCLKLVLHELVNEEWAIGLLRQLGFEYARSRELNGRRLLEFYLNLYYMRSARSVLHP
jgi:N-acetylglutamate synthase-like GNAT family acetyltransferase